MWWVEIKAGRSFIHYLHGQNGLNLGKINLFPNKNRVRWWETKMKAKNIFPPPLPPPRQPFPRPNFLSAVLFLKLMFHYSVLWFGILDVLFFSSLCVGPGSPKELRWEQFQWLSLSSFQWKRHADAGGWYEQWKQKECQSCRIEGFPPSDNPDKPRISTVPAHGQNISIKVEKLESWLRGAEECSVILI